MRPTVAARVLVVAVCCLVGATACTTSDDKSDDRTTATSSAAKSASPTLQQNPLPTALPTNQPEVRGNVVQTTCAAIPGGWGAAGKVTNPGAQDLTYEIVVYFTTEQATTLDFATATVKVAAGKTEPWKAEKKFAAQAKMLCPMPSISAH